MDRSQYHPREAATCLPAMAVVLLLGFVLHQPLGGIVAAGATFAVGMGSFRRLEGSRLLPMCLAPLGMATTTLLGTLAGHSAVVTVAAAGALGLAYGLVLIFSEDASWVALQSVIAFLVASAYPAWSWHALLRSSIILAGGSFQIGVHLLLWNKQVAILRDDFRRCHPRNVAHILWRNIRPQLFRQLDHRLGQMRYATRVCFTLMLAVVLSRMLPQVNSYWLPMTTLLVLKPDFYRTYTNSLGRVFGTFLGILAAGLLTWALHPHPLILCLLVLFFAWNALALQKVNYAIFTSVLTGWIVFLIATAGLPEIVVTANRLSDTAIGSAIALFSRAIGPKWDSIPGIATPITAQGTPATPVLD